MSKKARDLSGSSDVMKKLGGKGQLKNPFPSWAITQDIDPERHNAELAEIIEEDPRLTGSVLRYTNSAIYGGGQRFESIEDSILRLGYNRIKEIVLACYVEGFYHHQPIPKNMVILCRDIFDHSIATGICCRELAPLINSAVKPATAFTAGLLHHLGLYLLVCRIDRFHETTHRALQEQELRHWLEAEETTLSTNHAETGGMLLQLWDIPDTIHLAVRLHHHPPEGSIAEIVRIATLIANTPEEKMCEMKDRVSEEMPHFNDLWWDKNQQRILNLYENLGGLRGRLYRICPKI